MGVRGRPSSAALAVIGRNGIETVKRPEPPDDLTDEQAEEWREVCNRMPADWFPRETWALLAQYCRHVESARHIAQLVAAARASDGFTLEDYDRLLKMQEREGRAITSLATKMRISQQATIDKRTKKPPVTSTPWRS